MWKNKNTNKQVRKPVSNNFAPKRLAINFQPPTLILEYLVVDTGKLYHHKMRLDSIVKKNNVSRQDVLNYVKTKHHLYFISQKLKDDQILKFIDRILTRLGKNKPSLSNIQQEQNLSKYVSPSASNSNRDNEDQEQDDDFDYLNDDDQYEQDYEDYEEQPKTTHAAKQLQNKQNQVNKKSQQKSNKPQVTKNTFMTYCQQEYDQDNEQQGQAQWDLDIQENGDFDFV